MSGRTANQSPTSRRAAVGGGRSYPTRAPAPVIASPSPLVVAVSAFVDTRDTSFSGPKSLRPVLAPMHPGSRPQCGERVTPYAAGCALSGVDLDPKRWQSQRPSVWCDCRFAP